MAVDPIPEDSTVITDQQTASGRMDSAGYQVTGTVKKPTDAKTWLERLDAADKVMEKWRKRCQRIRRRYTEERSDADSKRRFAVLWSNTQTTIPALYARTPNSAVERRFKDSDPIARTVSEILQRSIDYTLDADNFDADMRQAVLDYSLYARGCAWGRYQPEFTTVQHPVPLIMGMDQGEYLRADTMAPVTPDQMLPDMPGMIMGEPQEELTFEKVCLDYVHWDDFMHEPSRNWTEVTWVARRCYMTKEQLKNRFGKIASEVPVEKNPETPAHSDPDLAAQAMATARSGKATVYEIWDKSTAKVYFVAKGFPKECLAVDEPYYDLPDFFPCPKPAYATLTTDTLIPYPDYVFYQDQAEEIDELTAKIGKLTDALRLVGFYPGEDSNALQQAFTPGGDNRLIPIAGWKEWTEGGGSGGRIDWVPIDKVLQALQGCFETRAQIIQDIYQITGISDIVRGASNPNETLGAQQLKAQFGSLRIRDRQQEIARFARDLMRITGAIIAQKFQPQTLHAMTGIEPTPEVMALMRNDAMRGFKIDIEADSTSQLDEQAEKEARTEFLTAVGGFLQQAMPIAQAAPQFTPLLMQMLLFGARGFRVGRELETTIEKVVSDMEQQAAQPPAPPEPTPEEQLQQRELELKGAEMQQRGQLGAGKLQLEGQRLALDAQKMKVDAGLKVAQLRQVPVQGKVT